MLRKYSSISWYIYVALNDTSCLRHPRSVMTRFQKSHQGSWFTTTWRKPRFHFRITAMLSSVRIATLFLWGPFHVTRYRLLHTRVAFAVLQSCFQLIAKFMLLFAEWLNYYEAGVDNMLLLWHVKNFASNWKGFVSLATQKNSCRRQRREMLSY